MHQTADNHIATVLFSPTKMVYDTIRVRTADFTKNMYPPPFEITCFELQPGDATPKDRHADVEIWIVLGGSGRLIYDGDERLLQAQDIVHFAPNRFHQVMNIGQEPLLIYSLAWLRCA